MTSAYAGLADSYSAVFGLGALVLFVFVITGAMEVGAEVWRRVSRR